MEMHPLTPSYGTLCRGAEMVELSSKMETAMIDHDWAPIDPEDNPGLMCTVCCQCQCCETPSEECPEGWDSGASNGAREALRKWREAKYPDRAVKFITPATDEEVERLGGLNR